MTHMTLDPCTPVIVGVGQVAERIGDRGYQARSPIELAVAAARAATADTGAGALIDTIDTIAATRQFENSAPGARAPLGRSTKFPLSVGRRLGAQPARAVLDVSGGQSPQHLLSEFSREINSGAADVVLLVGAEAMSTVRHLSATDSPPDFSDDPEDPDAVFEDRGFGLEGLICAAALAHGLTGAPAQYALLENARRAAKGMTRHAYSAEMGRLFEPFTHVAATNPYSAAPERRSADELVTVTERNRMIADPYPRFVVARDQVNQAAAVVLTSLDSARRLGVPPHKWVFLHGQSDLREQSLLERQAFSEAPTAVTAVRHALDTAELELGAIDFFDFYSCFPIAVTNIIDAIGLSPNDPRGLTLTGGLPFFGGAGNNYSMHAIAEAVSRARSKPGSYALVSANGGILSKTSVGIYSTVPVPLRQDRSDLLQAEMDARESPRLAVHANGWATIETYTVKHGRTGKSGIVIGRLQTSGERFVARVDAADDALMKLLEHADQPIGQHIHVTAHESQNVATMFDSHADQGDEPGC